MSGKLIYLIIFVAVICYIANRPSATKLALVPATPVHSDEAQPSALVEPDKKDGKKTFHGYSCTVDCSGHKAGYKWARQHGIDEVDDCDKAGETSNSPSFAEGCKAYVDENK